MRLRVTAHAIECLDCGGVLEIPAGVTPSGGLEQCKLDFFTEHAACVPGEPAAAVAPATDYCYSTDEERYTGGFASRVDALAEAIAEWDDDGHARAVWTAISTPVEISARYSADDVLEHLGDRACDEPLAGEFGDDWPPPQKGEALEELKAIVARFNSEIDAWVARRCPPNWFEATDVQRHDVEARDGRAHAGDESSPGGPVTQNGAAHPAIPGIPEISTTASDPRDGSQS